MASDLRDLQLALLEILKIIDQICKDNGIQYSLACGTALGAIRHNGFIPWDDDMDIAMTRNDFYKLENYINNHPELELNFIHTSCQNNTIYICGKICDKNTLVKESHFKTVEGYGAFVDVFPLDNIPNDDNERKKFKSKCRYLAKLIQHSAKIIPGKPHGLKHAFLLYGSFLYSHLFNTYKLVKELDELCTKYNNIETNYCGVPYFISYFNKSDFEELVELPFEGYTFMGPKKYENVLNASYEDYRIIPPPDKRVNHMVECYLLEQK